MKNVKAIKRKLFAVLCIVLIAAMALFITACETKEGQSFEQSTASATEVGQGNRSFTFTVEIDGVQKVYNVKTDKTTVGAALVELELIAGEDGPYGLYVKTVDGVTFDYEKDKAYWSFYVDGEYAISGVDKTDIVDGKNYSFKKEKA